MAERQLTFLMVFTKKENAEERLTANVNGFTQRDEGL